MRLELIYRAVLRRTYLGTSDRGFLYLRLMNLSRGRLLNLTQVSLISPTRNELCCIGCPQRKSSRTFSSLRYIVCRGCMWHFRNGGWFLCFRVLQRVVSSDPASFRVTTSDDKWGIWEDCYAGSAVSSSLRIDIIADHTPSIQVGGQVGSLMLTEIRQS
jgi:hypothetical protein